MGKPIQVLARDDYFGPRTTLVDRINAGSAGEYWSATSNPIQHAVVMMDPKTFIFTMTTGRSGTQYLAELLRHNLPDAECHHEILGWDRFGVDTPDVSHMCLFNSQGNVDHVQRFWDQKLNRIAATPRRFYVETSHLLMKAGLIENLAPLANVGQVHLIAMERDLFATIRSFRTRFDFHNRGNMWLWYLDPEYPKNIVNSRDLMDAGGINGICLWYIIEIRVRAAYYSKLLAGRPDVTIHRFTLEDLRSAEGASRLSAALGSNIQPQSIVLPPPQNVADPSVQLDPAEAGRIQKLLAATKFDVDALAQNAIVHGFRF